MFVLRRCVAVVLLAIACALGVASDASGQALDGAWMKMKVKASGVAMTPGLGTVAKAKITQTFYMHFAWDEQNDRYTYSVWTKDANGSWSETFSDTGSTFGADEVLASDWWVSVDLPMPGAKVEGYVTCRLTLKKDEQGVLKSAKFATLGGEAIDDSTLDGTKWFYGNLSISGATVPIAKLPFVPA